MNTIYSKIQLILLSITFFALAGCSTETIDKLDSVSNEISFSTTTSNTATRGVPIDNAGSGNFDASNGFQYAGRTFGVSAYSVENSATPILFFGSPDKGVRFSGKSSGANFNWTPAQKLYWPHLKRTMDLFAYTPFDKNITVSNASLPNTMQIKYNTDGATDLTNYTITKGDFKTATTASVARTSINPKGLQEDVMYAITRGFPTPFSQTEAVKTAKAPLHFKHTLTQIQFAAKTEPDVSVHIRSITLHNIKSAGSFEVAQSSYAYTNGSGAAVGNTTTGKWTCESTLPQANYYNVSLPWKGVQIVPSASETAYAPLTTHDQENVENTLMLIPQTILPWNPTKQTIDKNDSDAGEKGAYLRIYCTIEYKEKPYFPIENKAPGTETETSFSPTSKECIYVPFSSMNEGVNTWKAGSRVTYYLLFGGGYSEEGDIILSAVDINISIDEWGDVGVFDKDGNLQFEGSTASGDDLTPEEL